MKKFSSLLLITSLVIFSACHKDKIRTEKIPDNVRQMLPYKDGQVVRYTSSNGRSLQATVKLTPKTVSRIENGESYNIETLGYEFLMGQQQLVYGSIGSLHMIFMSIWSPEHNYQTGGGFDFMTDETMAKPICNGPRQTCVGTVTLNGKTFTDVLLIYNGSWNSTGDYLTKAWYTVDKGLIGFAYGTGVTYVRD